MWKAVHKYQSKGEQRDHIILIREQEKVKAADFFSATTKGGRNGEWKQEGGG